MTAGQRWSTDRPVKPGWYWWRILAGSASIYYVKEVNGEGIVEFMDDSTSLDKLMDGEWCGPLEPPHDQEAG